jgi:hypothetical protein
VHVPRFSVALDPTAAPPVVGGLSLFMTMPHHTRPAAVRPPVPATVKCIIPVKDVYGRFYMFNVPFDFIHAVPGMLKLVCPYPTIDFATRGCKILYPEAFASSVDDVYDPTFPTFPCIYEAGDGTNTVIYKKLDGGEMDQVRAKCATLSPKTIDGTCRGPNWVFFNA